MLLPYYLRGKVPYKNLFIRDKSYYTKLNATCLVKEVLQLQPEQQTILLDDGSSLPYDKLLIATGAAPVKPPIPGLSGEGVFHLWSLKDVAGLMPYFQKGQACSCPRFRFCITTGSLGRSDERTQRLNYRTDVKDYAYGPG